MNRLLLLREHPDLEAAIVASPLISSVLDRWEEIDLPNCWLVAGSIVQTFWNHIFGYASTHGIDDIDLAYFDSADVSERSEANHERRIESLFGDSTVKMDVKNEARVHLWYKNKFGLDIAPFNDVFSAIESFPTKVGAIGLRPGYQKVEVFAPYGLEDLKKLVVRPNERFASRSVYEAKVARWKDNWPDLDVRPWGRELC